MATNGSKWRILVGGVTSADKISCETSASLDITQDTVEVFCKELSILLPINFSPDRTNSATLFPTPVEEKSLR